MPCIFLLLIIIECSQNYSSELLCKVFAYSFLRWGTADAEIKVPSAGNAELSQVLNSI